MTSEKAPVFVCGLPRSGTTWISKTLCESGELVYLDEAWMLEKFLEMNNWYTDVHDNWRGFTPWAKKGVSNEFFTGQLAKLYGDLLYKASDGKRFLEKTPNWNLEFLHFLHELFPDAYYILIYRDGRNQIASIEANRVPKGRPFDFAKLARKWARSMDIIKEVQDSQLIEKCHIIRYEDLLTNFDGIFQSACNFVEIAPFQAKPFQANSSFTNSSQLKNFNQRWRDWPKDRIEQYLEIAGRQMSEWGYEISD